ncbi:hypothetical protein ASPCAL00403 [Aspergillus calidoustus]|uniref:Uncharacterized protein n=1 Tax=Aspergillus calidoustus TaxID=454130 RepID=A0A0U5FQ95_ASPCI|nr:hypothetical protein ASPCAL00403 [Aspergillus calidoustus]
MPPFIPSKRLSSEEPPPPKRHAFAKPTPASPSSSSSLTPVSDSDLTPLPTEFENDNGDEVENDEKDLSEAESAESDEVDWEDAIQSAPTFAPGFVSPQENLELTLDRNEVHLEDILQVFTCA